MSNMPPAIRSAMAPVSAVRMRTTSAIGETKILPSPISPVYAADATQRATSLTWSLHSKQRQGGEGMKVTLSQPC
eukprot:364282-Chlamydomonas_euryale.AAC.4